MFGRFFFTGVERNRYHTSRVIVRYLSGKATSMIGGWRALNRLRHLRAAFDKSEGHPRESCSGSENGRRGSICAGASAR
jgi:hypothetical protein